MSIKKFATSVAALFVASTLLVGCGGDPATPASSSAPAASDQLAKIKAAGEIRIGLEGVYPPYSFHDASGALVGIEKDMAELLAEDLGVKPVFIETKWDSLIAGMDVDKYDMVINQITPTDERKQKYDFTERYTRSIGKAAVAKDSTIQKLADLKGKRSAQTTTSNWAVEAKDFGAEIVATEGFVQSIELVATGRADVTLNDLVTFQMYFDEHPDSPVRLLDEEYEVGNCCAVLVNKGETELTDALNVSIEKRLADGSFAEISEKYVGADLTPAK